MKKLSKREIREIHAGEIANPVNFQCLHCEAETFTTPQGLYGHLLRRHDVYWAAEYGIDYVATKKRSNRHSVILTRKGVYRI